MLAANPGHSQPVDVYVDPVSLIIQIICVSVKLLFRMHLLLQVGQTLLQTKGVSGRQVNDSKNGRHLKEDYPVAIART